jgi:hypothetical protein
MKMKTLNILIELNLQLLRLPLTDSARISVQTRIMALAKKRRELAQ